MSRDGYKTAQSVNVIKKSTEPDNFVELDKIHYSNSGDSRVPHASSCIWHKKILTLMATASWRYREYGHALILKDERIQKIIHRFLSDKTKFDWKMPGRSIKQVTGLIRTTNSDNLSTWEAELK